MIEHRMVTNVLNVLLLKKKKNDKKASQWSEYLPKGCSEFKVHVQEGVAGKESKDS